MQGTSFEDILVAHSLKIKWVQYNIGPNWLIVWEKQLKHSSKYPLFSTEERKSHRFRTTRGWVNDDIPLNINKLLNYGSVLTDLFCWNIVIPWQKYSMLWTVYNFSCSHLWAITASSSACVTFSLLSLCYKLTSHHICTARCAIWAA